MKGWMVTGLIAGLCGMSLLAVERAESAEPVSGLRDPRGRSFDLVPIIRIHDGARQRGIGTSTHLTRRSRFYQGAGVQ